MKEYIEYNTKQGITDLLSEIELEMIASVKLPNNNFNYNENGELVEEYSSQKYLRVDYLASLRPVSFDFKIVAYRFLD